MKYVTNLLFAMVVVPTNMDIWASCKVNYGEKGTYPTIAKVIKYDGKHVWVTLDGMSLAKKYYKKKLVKLKDSQCMPLVATKRK